jgi:hypothetical protein
VKNETGKVSTEEVPPSKKITDNVVKDYKLIEYSFNTYFLTIMQ